MKRFILYLLLVCTTCTGKIWAMPAEQGQTSVKRILIIDSYRQELYWSSALRRKIEASLLTLYPEARIMHGCINTDVAVTRSGASLAMRSIFWTLTEDTGRAPSATSLASSSLFANNVAPDVLVFIGDEGFLHYLDFAFQLQHWGSVPVVLCSVNELISSQGWNPQVPDEFENMIPVENCRYVEAFYTRDMKEFSPYVQKRPAVVNGEKGNVYSTNLNYTGVKVRVPVRENLQLIKHLLPDLRELVWVDDDYYSSQYVYKQVKQELKQIMPAVHLTPMIHNRTNIDSIYNAMTQLVDGRAFLTWALNVDASHSDRSDQAIDSLFSYSSSLPPLFTMSERGFRCNYWIGGCYVAQDEIVSKTVRLIDRVLKGDSASLIPFETVENKGVILNRAALMREGLLDEANTLEDVTFVNDPPTFYQRYEWQVLLFVLLLVGLLGVCIYRVFQWSYDKRIRKNLERYKRLYDNLQTIYSNSSVDLTFFSKDGTRLLSIVNGEEELLDADSRFALNLFQSTRLTAGQKAFLKKNGLLNVELKFNKEAQLVKSGFDVHKTYHVIVKELKENALSDYGYICVVVDISQLSQERREKERMEFLFRFAADSARVGLAFYSVDNGEGLATDAWHQILNEPEVDSGLPAYRNVLADDRVLLLEYKQKLLSGEQVPDFSHDIRVMDSDNMIRWVRQNCYYIPEHRLLVELSMDINEQMQSENRLREAKLAAEQVNDETSKFLADISHEMRTPLNSIVGFSAVLAAQDEEREAYIPIILRNCKLLVALIDNILDLSGLDSGQIQLKKEWMDTSLLEGEMEDYIRTNLYGKPLRVIVSIPETDRFIFVDPVYFRKLSMSMLTNAVKFTETGSISFGHRTVEGYHYFEITDTGCGIREEDLTRIFKRFEKLNTYIQGTGLGLSLCKSIVEHMGGEIGVRSEWGKGSTFWFRLPKE